MVTLYSGEVNGFNEEHKRIIEAIARQIAHTLQSAAESDVMSQRDALTRLSSLQQLDQFVEAKETDINRNVSTPPNTKTLA